MYCSVTLSALTLCNYHHHPTLELFCLPKLKLYSLNTNYPCSSAFLALIYIVRNVPDQDYYLSEIENFGFQITMFQRTMFSIARSLLLSTNSNIHIWLFSFFLLELKLKFQRSEEWMCIHKDVQHSNFCLLARVLSTV